MLTPEQFVAAWSKYGQLHRFDASIGDIESLPVLTKDFLIRAGLPMSQDFDSPGTEICADLPRLADCVASDRTVVGQGQHLRVFSKYVYAGKVLGFDCIEELTGVLYSANPSWPDYVRIAFMNSSVQQYAEYRLILKRFRNWQNEQVDATPNHQPEEVDEDLYCEQCAEVAEQLRTSDPAACTEADSLLAGGGLMSDDGLPSQVWTETVYGLDICRWY